MSIYICTLLHARRMEDARAMFCCDLTHHTWHALKCPPVRHHYIKTKSPPIQTLWKILNTQLPKRKRRCRGWTGGRSMMATDLYV